jgi:hypothetical protein
MGLYVQSLDHLPADAHRDYYVYLLDYGWPEPLGEALTNNFQRMAEMAEKSNAVVIRSTNRVHFADQVLSWHSVNGENAGKMLPAILITNRNPHLFRETRSENNTEPIESNLKLILIPLQKFCKNPDEVTTLTIRLFADIKAGKQLRDFKVGRKVRKGGKAKAEAMILEPAKKTPSITMTDVINFLQSRTGQHHNEPGNKMQKTVHPVHFEDFSGEQFERLVFAYVNRRKNWNKIEWLGQTGGDGGRDIWAEDGIESHCYQCANYQQMVFKKASDDIRKLSANKTIPDKLIVVCGSTVSPEMRTKIANYALRYAIKDTQVWSGVELEEKLRKEASDLLERFVKGEAFPENAQPLILNTKPSEVSDLEIIQLMTECFDRPAFTTAFRNESNIPAFEQAITDTIEVLNTGMHRLRDGTLIRKIPSRHQLSDANLRNELSLITQLVVRLRDTFNKLRSDKEIKQCPCGKSDCTTWILSDKACNEMDSIRKEIFKEFKKIHPPFTLQTQ